MTRKPVPKELAFLISQERISLQHFRSEGLNAGIRKLHSGLPQSCLRTWSRARSY